MARGLKKHMKRLNAPKHWMLDKLGGAFAPKPSSEPHKPREYLPLILIIRNRLKYVLTYPAGFMEVVSIPEINENFRLLYESKGSFRLHSIRDEEAKVFMLSGFSACNSIKKGISHRVREYKEKGIERVLVP